MPTHSGYGYATRAPELASRFGGQPSYHNSTHASERAGSTFVAETLKSRLSCPLGSMPSSANAASAAVSAAEDDPLAGVAPAKTNKSGSAANDAARDTESSTGLLGITAGTLLVATTSAGVVAIETG